MGKETLEEASSKVAHMLGTKDSFEYVKMSFELGAKWQQKRSYSEEDMSKAFFQGWITRERFDDLSPDIIYPKGLDYEEKQDYAFNLWFEQFKKK